MNRVKEAKKSYREAKKEARAIKAELSELKTKGEEIKRQLETITEALAKCEEERAKIIKDSISKSAITETNPELEENRRMYRVLHDRKEYLMELASHLTPQIEEAKDKHQMYPERILPTAAKSLKDALMEEIFEEARKAAFDKIKLAWGLHCLYPTSPFRGGGFLHYDAFLSQKLFPEPKVELDKLKEQARALIEAE